MASKGMRSLVWVVLTTAMASQIGCQEQLMRERDALWTQNQELQEALTQQQRALESCEADRNRLTAQVDQLQTMQVPPPPAAAVVAPPQPIMMETAFSDIAGIETEKTAAGITVRIPGDVLFSPGRVNLKETSKSTLNKIATVINRDYPGNTIRVEGHTDTDPIRKSKWTDNLELSLERAATVHRYLQKQGVEPKRLEAVGLGQWTPRNSKSKSRRVEIVVVQ